MQIFQFPGEEIFMKKLHFIGIGGIGMSALAAGAVDCDYQVSGSDRGADKPENARIINALKKRGIKIYPQDGSRFSEAELPDQIVYSSAIEEDNPDFAAAGEIPRIHRSELLKQLLGDFQKISIAVTGSCGKSTVTGYIAETLERLNSDPVMISGALSKRFQTPFNAGNYRSGKGKYLVFEADESDKSLLNYGADYAVILNIGTDHYSKAELVDVFSTFLKNIRCGAVLSQEVFDAVKENLPENLHIEVISGTDFTYVPGGKNPPHAILSDMKSLVLPAPGKHMAFNALCIKKLMDMLNFEPEAVLKNLSRFDGLWRRNDFAGRTPAGTMVFDDYAHNPEKIISCLSGMRERCGGKLFAVFQPHGYKPFGFMEEELFHLLENFLDKDDRFILLEPFYAGGTSSFSPHSDDVCRKWQQKSAQPERFVFCKDREETRSFILRNAGENDLAVIMGARDNSLSDFAASFAL